KKLAALVRRLPGDVIRYSDHTIGDGERVLAEACRLGLEGIVSKRRDLPHTAGRTRTWLKTKCIQRHEFVIGGFTDPEGSREGIGALLVGVREAPPANRCYGPWLAKTLSFPSFRTASTEYFSAFGPSIPGEPTGMPGTARPTTSFGCSARRRATSSAGT